MQNLIFLKIEIIILLLSFFYVLCYLWEKLYKAFFKVKKVIKKDEISTVKTALNKVDLNTKEKSYKKDASEKKLSDIEKTKLVEIVRRVKTNSLKWYFDTAKWLIIEGLSIDKFNKDLNLELASIYQREKKYENAEIIYNDLLDVYKWDYEIMKNLAYIYALQSKLNESKEMYEKVHNKNTWDEEVINMLSEITYDLKDYKLALKYINQYLKFKPRDLDKYNMKAVCFEELRDFKDSLEMHKKILELQPYNTHSRDKVRELQQFI